MANIPDELRYTDEHEWVSGDVSAGAVVTIGITEYATAALGDIVYVEAPAVGDTVKAGEVCGELESTKAVSELYSPVTGVVTEVNQAVLDAPEILNRDAYGDGWLLKIKASAANTKLLNAEQYAAIVD
ncbi:MAG: glycine cleavage system protein GcvH [Demequinaceae bacterium]|nr:glycine cleavage system protein GcvH [Demequinaceae bacterium]